MLTPMEVQKVNAALQDCAFSNPRAGGPVAWGNVARSRQPGGLFVVKDGGQIRMEGSAGREEDGGAEERGEGQ
jgi:hypothetical protein